ncbi:hypothetical protein PCOAH_00028920 [Plasmodium coatneyi]|uniref:KIR protein n=1 Tax=Plasmodium coatneyi TaxID=208452 RepID=A0A1B1E0R4_9APIC|nr:hypothetical protein PCOAH_00028920 [Plasmodium coatneyi]ANQ08623.1 hypothetical protein PCOAH_00028920 [Plasmodium coatneyi]
MSKIYQQLKATPGENECGSLGHHSSKDVFNENKTKFDLQQDYEPKGDKLKKYYESCSDYYRRTYRTTTPSVPTNVEEKCKNGGTNPTDPYCTKFKTTYAKYCQQNSTEEACAIVNGVEASSARSGVPAARSSSSTVAPIVSSTLGTALVGLPTMYKLLPSWFSNYSGGGRGSTNNNRSNTRKGRSVRRDLDTLTAADSSTIYSTEYSTVDDVSTTNSMSDRASTIFEGPSKRRKTVAGITNNSNRRPKNIMYQRI